MTSKMPLPLQKSEKGQSNVLGVVLLLSVVFVASTATVLAGTTLIQATQDASNTKSAEYAMSQFDSEASLVALDQNTNSRTVQLGVSSSGQTSVESGGNIKVEVVDPIDSTRDTVVDTDINSIVYQNNNANAKVAYQGGGVWKKTSSGTTMISPPEFHYNGETLTFPIVRVDPSSDISSGEVTVKSSGSETKFPDSDRGDAFTNPAQGKRIEVTITSEYYEGWSRFYQERVPGAKVKETDAANNKIVVELGQPEVDTTWSSGIYATGGNVEAGSGSPTVDGPISSDSNVDDELCSNAATTCDENMDSQVTPLDNIINSKIEQARDNPGEVTELSTTAVKNADLEGGKTYFVDGDIILGNSDKLEAELNGKNISLVVAGDIMVDKGELVVDDTGTDKNDALRIYSSGEMGIRNGPVHVEGSSTDAEHLQVYGKSTMEVAMVNGANSRFEGALYAPRNEQVSGINTAMDKIKPSSQNKCEMDDGTYADFCLGSGAGSVEGAVTGGPTKLAQGTGIAYDTDLETIQPQLQADSLLPPPLTYMHVGVNDVEVTSGT